jgi:DNA-binding CsgD family transcriptional regulator
MGVDMEQERIVDEIYRAATHDTPWEDVLALITEATGGNFAYYQEHDMATGAVVRLMHDCAPIELIDIYVNYWSRRDPRVGYALRHPRQALYTDYGVMGDEAGIARNEFYNEYLAAIDVRYMAASSIPITRDRTGFIGINRRQSAGHVDREQCDLFLALRPHFARALAIESRLRLAEAKADVLGDTLNTFAYGIVIVDNGATIRWANDAARGMLAAQNGIGTERGVLEAAASTERRLLRRLIATACRSNAEEISAPGGSLMIGRGSATVIEVLVAPLPRRSDMVASLTGYTSRAIVFLHSSATRQHAVGDALTVLYGLTPVEVRLAIALSDGMTLKQVADELETTHETARTYIKRIYSKTGANTQAKLVRAVLNSPASLVIRGRN